MRTLALALVLLLAVIPALAQQPQPQAPAQPALDPARNPLDAVLVQWEKKMQGVENLAAQLIRTTVNRAFNTTDVYEGYAKYQKPNRALMELRKKSDPQVFEKLLFTQNFVYEIRPQDKLIRVHQPPPPKPGQIADDNVMSFVFGMKAEEAKRRYDLVLDKADDPNYIYLKIQPRFPEDKQEFLMARLVLFKRDYLPRQFWYVEPSQNQITYDIPKIEANSPSVTATDFAKPQTPAGWKMETVPRPNPQAGGNVPPRVARPNR
jgi:TIGR03009 family protein